MIPSSAASGPDPLIGRDREREAIPARLLDSDIRLVVLTTQLEARTTEPLVALAIRRGLI